jgi:Histone deacetylase domain
MIPLIYHHRYNITAFGLERLHPFDGCKYRRIHETLVSRGLRRAREFVRPRPVSRADLLAVHTTEYLQSLRDPEALARILEVPAVSRLPAWAIDWRILQPMRFATGGTILACRLALEHGISINLGGGYHHAAAGWGGGFCVYSDAALAAKLLHVEGKARLARRQHRPRAGHPGGDGPLGWLLVSIVEDPRGLDRGHPDAARPIKIGLLFRRELSVQQVGTIHLDQSSTPSLIGVNQLATGNLPRQAVADDASLRICHDLSTNSFC